MEILKFIQELIATHGETFGLVIGALASIGYAIHSAEKFIPNAIKKHFEKHSEEQKTEHVQASKYRKAIVPKIKKELAYLAEITNVDRAFLFEFSNGTSNLVGLPFLYATATVEVTKPKIPQVSTQYQKINVSLVADFIQTLETESYIYFKNLDDIKEKFPMVYNYMKPNEAESALFYALYNDEDSIGFIGVTCVRREFERSMVLPKVAVTAQVISNLLNYDKMKSELN